MNAFDFAPLFRTAIGFDRLARLVDAAAAGDVTYPPYNIEKTGDDSYRLTMAVAGFGPDDIEITSKDNTLVVSGRVNARGPEGRGAVSRHRRPRVRAAVRARRPRHGRGRGAAERAAACRPEARGAGGAEAAPHPSREPADAGDARQRQRRHRPGGITPRRPAHGGGRKAPSSLARQPKRNTEIGRAAVAALAADLRLDARDFPTQFGDIGLQFLHPQAVELEVLQAARLGARQIVFHHRRLPCGWCVPVSSAWRARRLTRCGPASICAALRIIPGPLPSARAGCASREG